MRRVWLLFVFLLQQAPSFAQQAQEELFRVVDEMVQPQSQGEPMPDLEDYSESLFRFLTRPLDLNRATADDFRYLPFLTEPEIAQILAHREHYGGFSAVEELQAVRGLPLSQARRLRIYCIVSQSPGLANLFPGIFQSKNHSFTFRTVFRTDQQPDPAHHGSPLRWYGRYRLAKPGVFSVGVTAEKDPGEAGFFWEPDRGRYGLDYLSAHLMVENTAGFRKIILGDYSAAFGQGLVFAQGFTMGQNAQTVTSQKKRAQGLAPYTSAMEGRQLRGICMQRSIGRVEASLLASVKRLDASVALPADSPSDDNPFPVFRTIRTSGLHRTKGERMGQGVLQESLLGGQVRLVSGNRLNSVGITAMGAAYSEPINPAPAPYNSAYFRGDRTWAGSVHYAQTFQNLSFFGESALSNGNAWAHYHGVMAAISRQLDVGLSFRDYAVGYAAPYSAGFGHTSLTANERGLYLGIQLRPTHKLVVNSAFDLYQKPWLAYRASRPSVASGAMLRLTWQPTRKATFYAQGQQDQQERDLPMETSGQFRAPQPIQVSQVMASGEFSPAERWLFRTRVQASKSQVAGSKAKAGSAITQDLTYQGRFFRVSARISAFSVQDPDNRLFVLERNVLGAYSFGQLSGKGTRYYLLFAVKPSRQLELWARLAQTRLIDPAMDLDPAARLRPTTEISLQARIWLSPQKINLF